jgi:hypothetical protein
MVELGTQMPVHVDLMSDCCGFFNDLCDTGLYCNECGEEISESIGKVHNEVKDMLCSMWGFRGEEGVGMDFRQCPKTMEKWIAISRKYGLLQL